MNVRFDEDTERRLDHVSERFGVKSSLLIRNAVRAYLDSIEGRDSIVLHAQDAKVAETSDKPNSPEIQSPRTQVKFEPATKPKTKPKAP